MDFRSMLEESLEAWSYTRGGVLEEARNLPEKDFGFRASEKSRSISELPQHVIESGLLISDVLSRPDGDFRRKSRDARRRHPLRPVRGRQRGRRRRRGRGLPRPRHAPRADGCRQSPAVAPLREPGGPPAVRAGGEDDLAALPSAHLRALRRRE